MRASALGRDQPARHGLGGGKHGAQIEIELARAAHRLLLDERLGPGATDIVDEDIDDAQRVGRSEEHTYELQSLMRISYAVFCLKKKKICMYTFKTITYKQYI